MTMFTAYAKWIDRSRSSGLRYLSSLGAMLLLLVSVSAQSRSVAPEKGSKATDRIISPSETFQSATAPEQVKQVATEKVATKEEGSLKGQVSGTRMATAKEKSAPPSPEAVGMEEEMETLKARIDAMGPNAVSLEHERLKQLEQEHTRLQNNNQPR